MAGGIDGGKGDRFFGGELLKYFRGVDGQTGETLARQAQRQREDRDEELLLRIAAADTDDGSSEARTVAQNLLAKLFRADDPLAASTRTIAVMHLVDGLTLEEVAREAGLSVSGVRKRLRTLRGRLQELEGVTQ